ncbi:MAG TPA: hypothetical protein VIM34_23470 [Burkholderiaceae bacterium]
MPSQPFHRRFLRRTVWVTLVAWVLAWGSGVASACQLPAKGPGVATVVASLHDRSTELGMRTMPASHAEARHHDGHATPAGPANNDGCRKFCTDTSSSVVKTNPVQADVLGPPLVASVGWPVAARTASVATWWPTEQPASQGPPLVIRLLCV